MAEIQLKMVRWSKVRVTRGIKKCTSRRRIHGNVGDTFSVEDKNYVITKIEQKRLGDIIKNLYHAEGADSPSDLEKIFKMVWRTPVLDYDLVLYVHWFEEVK